MLDDSIPLDYSADMQNKLTLVPMQRTCNNMFQIASIYSYCLSRGIKLAIDCSHAPTADALLKELGDPFERGTADGLILQMHNLDSVPIPEMIAGKFTCVLGWFQDPRYFIGNEDAIRELYKPLTGERVDGTLGIHIRLGDYTGDKYAKDYFTISKHDIETSYYLLGRPRVKKMIIFSDEPDKARELVPWDGDNVVMSKAEAPFDTLREMSSCEYLIASNSTMSWWAAWLGKIKNVAVHYPWTKFHNQDCLYMPFWHVYN